MDLSPLETLCLHYLLHVRGLRSPESVMAEPGFDGPAVIDSISAAAEDDGPLKVALRAPFLGKHAWQGITAEALLMAECFRRNLGVALPYGGGYVPFDFLVFTRKHNYRVQVKYGGYERFASWMVQVRRRGNVDPYKEGDFDILAACGPDGVFYLIPFAALKGRKSLHIPRRERVRDTKPGFPIQKWRERWEIFK
jgi:hypothetical protein